MFDGYPGHAYDIVAEIKSSASISSSWLPRFIHVLNDFHLYNTVTCSKFIQLEPS